jgi:large subunit ribosomal protein L35
MPKVKTHTGASKRFKVTSKGKILFNKSGRRHLLSKKTSKRKRRLAVCGQFVGHEKIRIKNILSGS